MNSKLSEVKNGGGDNLAATAMFLVDSLEGRANPAKGSIPVGPAEREEPTETPTSSPTSKIAVAPSRKLTPARNVAPPSVFENNGSGSTDATNLTSSSSGSRVLFATDEWFASADNLLLPTSPIFIPDLYCEQGKVMDGWESRRRRDAGHDWCVIQLSQRGQLFGLEIDTAHFTGNHAPRISVQSMDLQKSGSDTLSHISWMPGALERAVQGGGRIGSCKTPSEIALAEQACETVAQASGGCWTELLPITPLNPGYEETRLHTFLFDVPTTATHIRVNYYPDGGVARLKLWGRPIAYDGPSSQESSGLYSSVATTDSYTVIPHNSSGAMPSQCNFKDPELTLGGTGIMCSNKHFGVPQNLVQANLGVDMGDGWETARHPDRPAVLVKDPLTGLVDSLLQDWALLQLGTPAMHGVSRLILDTRHFKGNFPESVKVEGCFIDNSEELENAKWFPLVPRTRMGPDSEHVFTREKGQVEHAHHPVSHVRVSIYPDGGLSRVRLYGPTNSEGEQTIIRSLL